MESFVLKRFGFSRVNEKSMCEVFFREFRAKVMQHKKKTPRAVCNRYDSLNCSSGVEICVID